MRKVVDALPENYQTAANNAARRFLVNPETDLLSRRLATDNVPNSTMITVRRGVFTGHKLRIHYASRGRAPQWRTIDPIGLVTVRDKGYLLATQVGTHRTFQLSRIIAASELPEAAQRSDQVDLERIWAERCAQFLSEGHIPVQIRVDPARRDQLLDMAEAVRAEQPEPDGWLRLEVTFQDLWHAEWALWQLGTNAEALAPDALRASIRNRAQTIADRYAPTG